MTVLETVLYFVVPSVGLYLLIAALVIAPRTARRARYRAGQPWPHAPLWWIANPEGADLPEPSAASGGERGGARGNW